MTAPYGYGPVPGMAPPLGWVATPWGPRWRGPVGRVRNPWGQIGLSVITCGIWEIFWSYQTHDDLRRYRGAGLDSTVVILLAILARLAIMFTVPSEIEQMYREEGLEPPFSTMIGLWFLLPLVGQLVWYLKVQEALNGFWLARGAAPA